ncbi:recombinase family protein [Candidatus Woesearchaeota archaeon]|nr:recombinase family protein [Candidatus Woesearchaeota archaeon]
MKDIACIYARISVIRNKDEPSNSIENQLEICRDKIKQNKWDLYKEYIDKGESGGKASRPFLDQLMKEAKDDKFNIIICYSVDRWMRSLIHLHESFNILDKLNKRFIIIRENIDTGDNSIIGRASRNLVLNLFSSVAQFERELISERTILGLKRKISLGVRVGRAPYGFKVKDGVMIQDPNSINDIKEIFKLWNEGSTYNEIVDKYGISLASVYSIIRNKIYLEERIIKKEEFEKANKRIKGRFGR